MCEVEDDGTRMLFVSVRRNLSRIAVDMELLADVVQRLQALDCVRVVAGYKGFGGCGFCVSGVVVGGWWFTVLCHVCFLGGGFMVLGGGFSGLLPLIGLVFTVGLCYPPSPLMTC